MFNKRKNSNNDQWCATLVNYFDMRKGVDLSFSLVKECIIDISFKNDVISEIWDIFVIVLHWWSDVTLVRF